jgi:hypothetical protein
MVSEHEPLEDDDYYVVDATEKQRSLRDGNSYLSGCFVACSRLLLLFYY